MSITRRLRPSEAPFASFVPLKFTLAYLTLTLALAIWGPIDYYMFPVIRTAMFMLAVMVAMVFGYTYGIATEIKEARTIRLVDDQFVRRLLDVSLAISIIALLMSIGNASISGQLNTDISSIGDAYSAGYENYERNSGTYSLSFIIYSLSLPFNFIAMVLGLYYFFLLNPIRRLTVAGLIISSLIFYVVGSGKQKQLGDILIYLFTVAALKYGTRRKPIRVKWLVLGLTVGVLALMVFVAVLGQRYSVLGVDIANINQRVNSRIYFDTEHPLFKLVGMDYGLNLAMFLSYLSQGYYGLGLALETDWHWTHFMGFSYSISVLANRILGLDWEWPNTLLIQVANTTGWDESKWHTVFTHFATDFTFAGTAILFGYFAYVYSRAWAAAIRYENPFAILTFALLTVGAFFMPANNQLLHSPGGLFTAIVVSSLYILMGSRYNRPPSLWGGQLRRSRRAQRQP